MGLERLMALILTGSLALAASAQDISGTVRRERDPHPVADVRLSLRNVDTGAIVSETVSDANGAFSFSSPKPGLYVIEAVDPRGVHVTTKPIAFTDSPLTTDVILPTSRTKAALYIAALGSVVAVGAIGGIAATGGGVPTVQSPER